MNKDSEKCILYCHCAYARAVPKDVKQSVLEQLTASGTAFEAVADLCEMSANQDPSLQHFAKQDNLQIVACYPRAVKWLFSAANAPLPEGQVQVQNMRTETADSIVGAVVGHVTKTDSEESP